MRIGFEFQGKHDSTGDGSAAPLIGTEMYILYNSVVAFVCLTLFFLCARIALMLIFPSKLAEWENETNRIIVKNWHNIK